MSNAIYLKLLEKAHKLGVPVYASDSVFETAHVLNIHLPDKRWILISALGLTCRGYNPVTVLAHELGHVVDCNARPWAYEEWGTGGCYGPTTWMSLMDVEMTAWDYAISLLKEAGFTDWATFENDRARALESYDARHNPWRECHGLERA